MQLNIFYSRVILVTKNRSPFSILYTTPSAKLLIDGTFGRVCKITYLIFTHRWPEYSTVKKATMMVGTWNLNGRVSPPSSTMLFDLTF